MVTVAGWGKDHEVPDHAPSTPKEVQLKSLGVARWPQSTEPSPDEKFQSDLKAIKDKIETEIIIPGIA